MSVPSALPIAASLIRFFIRLPFPMMLDEHRVHVVPISGKWVAGSTDGSVPGDPPHVALQLLHAQVSVPGVRPGFNEGLDLLLGRPPAAETPMLVNETQTWIEATTPFFRLDEEPDNDLTTQTFDRCLTVINRLVRAYSIVSNNPYATVVSKERLDPMIGFLVIDENGSSAGLSVMTLHFNLPSPGHRLLPGREALVDEQMDLQAKKHPFVKPREWLERARYAGRVWGDYDDAVMKLEIASETLLFAAVLMAMVDEGKASADIDQALDGERGYRHFITDVVPQHVGGSWDITKAGSAVESYWSKLYYRRNTIVHRGKPMTPGDLAEAEQGHDDLVNHLIACVLKRPRRLPRTIVALLGEPGLKNRNKLSRFLQERIAAFATESAPFWWPSDLAGRT